MSGKKILMIIGEFTEDYETMVISGKWHIQTFV